MRKPAGWTSSDVVVKLRGALNLRQRGIKIGHGGTLDPMATGVLPICIGSATRFSEYLMSGDKRYDASIRMGESTDTYDADGSVIQIADASGVTSDEFVEALKRFRGEFHQLPPIYSAIKKDGRRLHTVARNGMTIDLPKRRVKVHSIALLRWMPPIADIEVRCDKGFYVRSLAHDIGTVLGCGAHLTSLNRIRSGIFSLAESVALDELLQLADDDEWTRLLKPIDHVLQSLHAIVANAREAADFVHGRTFYPSSLQQFTLDAGEGYRVYALDGQFLGLAESAPSSGSVKPSLVLPYAKMLIL